jgi:hypothetical protein
MEEGECLSTFSATDCLTHLGRAVLKKVLRLKMQIDFECAATRW